MSTEETVVDQEIEIPAEVLNDFAPEDTQETEMETEVSENETSPAPASDAMEDGMDSEETPETSDEEDKNIPSEVLNGFIMGETASPEVSAVTSQTKNDEPTKVVPEQPVVDSRIDSSLVPGTESFFDSCETEAIKEVEKSLGTAYDEYNSKHKVRFDYFLKKAMDKRTASYNENVNFYKEYDAQMKAKEEADKKYNVFMQEYKTIISDQKKFEVMQKTLNNLKAKDYIKLDSEMKACNYDNVIKLAKKVASLVDKKSKKPEASTLPKPRTRKAGVLSVSDLFI